MDFFSLGTESVHIGVSLTIVSSIRTNRHDVAAGWVDIVIIRLACTPHDVEDVTMQVERMWETTRDRDLDGGIISR